MPDPVQYVQGRRMRRCSIAASGALLSDLVVAALTAQKAGRGDACAAHIVGYRLMSASADVAMANPDGTGSITVPSTSFPYDPAATHAGQDTLLSGSATITVEVYLSDIPEGF